MKKIKFLIASMLGAIALVFACVLGINVKAADSFPYYAASDERTSDIAKSTKFLDDNTLSVSTDGASKANIITFTENDGYTKALAHLSNGGGFIFSSKKDINLTIKFFVRDGTNFYDGTYTFSNDLGSGDTTATAVKSVTVQLAKDASTTLTAKAGTKDRRIAIVEISYEEQSVSSDYELDSISVTNSKTYNLGDSFDATAISVKGLYKNKSDVSDTKELSISSDDYSVVLKNSSNVTVTSFETAGTYTVTVTVNDTEISKSINISIANILLYKFYNADHTNGNDLVVSSNITVKSASKKDDRTNTFNGSTIVNYMQSAEIDFTLDDKASVEFYITQTSSTTNVHDRTYYIKDSSGNIIEGTGFTPVFKPSNNTTVSGYQTVVLPQGTYKLLSPCGTLNVYGMKIDYDTTETAIDTEKFVNFEWQFDNVQTPSKIRFVGTINNVTDLSKLTNVKVTMVLKKISNQKAESSYAGTIDMPKVYSKVMNGTNVLKDKVDNTYYAVCVMSGLDTLKTTLNGKDATNGWMIEAKLNYTYDGVSYIVSASGNITLIAKAS